METVSAYAYLLAREQALCAVRARCASVRGETHTSESACRAAAADANRVNLLATGTSREDAVNAVSLPVSRATLEACLAAYATTACNEEFTPPQCPSPPPRHAVGVGEACGPAEGSPACDAAPQAGFCQQRGTAACSTCVGVDIPAPMSCADDMACASRHCAFGACVATARRKVVGEACTPGQCMEGLHCRFTGGMGTCAARGGAGSTCNAQVPCVADLACVDSGAGPTCQSKLEDGQACTRTSVPPCANQCVYASPDATTGTCGSPTAAPTAGQACVGTLCGGLAFQQETNAQGAVTSCTCVALQQDGEACTFDSACASGHCLAVTGTCGTPGMDGAPCALPADCVSHACALSDGDPAPRCRSAACSSAAPACDPLPANAAVSGAVTLEAGQAVGGSACEGAGAWFRIPGPHAEDATFRFHFTLDAQDVNAALELDVFREAMDGNTSQVTNILCIAVADQPGRCTVIAGGDQNVLVHARPRAGDPSSAFHVAYSAVPSGGGACDVVPQNTTPATAVALALGGAPVDATFCSLSSRTEFHWRVDGPFAQGDPVVFTLDGARSLGVQVVANPGPTEEILAECLAAPAFPDCVATVTTAVTSLYLRTRENPAVDDREDFQLSVRRGP